MRGRSYVVALLFLAACGNDDGGTPQATQAPTTAAASTAAPSESDVASTLKEAAIAAEEYSVDKETYPANLAELTATGFQPIPGVTVAVVSASKTAYCLSAAGGGVTLYYSSTVGKVSPQRCS